MRDCEIARCEVARLRDCEIARLRDCEIARCETQDARCRCDVRDVKDAKREIQEREM